MNTTIVPGSTRKPRSARNRRGERKSRMPVATAVAKHLITASASMNCQLYLAEGCGASTDICKPP
jgi:hypothetical protein